MKAALNSLVEQDALDMEDDSTKFSVSSVVMDVCRVGVRRFVDSWNNHPIPGKAASAGQLHRYRSCAHTGRGTPDFVMRQANRVSVVPAQIVPSVQEAVLGYEQATGSSLAAPRTFGRDLLGPILIKKRSDKLKITSDSILENFFRAQ